MADPNILILRGSEIQLIWWADSGVPLITALLYMYPCTMYMNFLSLNVKADWPIAICADFWVHTTKNQHILVWPFTHGPWVKVIRKISNCFNLKPLIVQNYSVADEVVFSFVENMDHNTDITKLWRIDGRAKRTAENEAISCNGISFSLSKQLAVTFNKQFNTSKLGRHSSSRETRLVTRETKRKPMEMAETFTADIVTRAIKSCRNSKVFGPTNSAYSTW